MKIKQIAYAFSFLASIGLTSCDNFLDLKPISEETQENAYSTANQLEAALTGCYETFQSSDFYIWDNVLLQDVRSDNHYAGGDNPEIFAYDAVNVTPINSKVNSMWSTLYNGIAKANLTIVKAKEITDPKLSEERRNQIIGEALFLRSNHYYNLVRHFGGVPLILSPVTSIDPEQLYVPRNTTEEVYKQIIADLEQTAQLLPDSYGSDNSINKARATKGAANALMVKALMQQPTPDYTLAVEKANLVINSDAGYRLLEDYNHLFDGNHYNNEESIIEVQFLGSPEGNWGPQMYLPPSISGDTWRKFATPSHDLINAYDALNDKVRKEASVLFEDAPWSDEYWGNKVGSSVPFAYKQKNASGWNSADRQYILRLADIILLKAEALNNLGDTEAAAKLVDQIRERVSLPAVGAADRTDKATMAKIILNERRLELAQEGQRWDDLVRNGVLLEVMNNLEEIDLRTNLKVNYNVTEADILLPIPQQELDRNPALEQN